MRRYAEYATFVGDHRYGDRLHDATRTAEFTAARKSLAAALPIRREALSPQDQISLGVFVDGTKRNLSFEPFAGYRSMSMGALGNFQSDFADLLAASPMATLVQNDQMLARMVAYPERVDQELARLREGTALGRVAPRSVLDRALTQLDAQLTPPIEGPFFLPFKQFGSDISAAQQRALRARAVRAINTHVLPSLRQLRRFVADDYLTIAPADGASSRYRGGDQVYAAVLRAQTTTDLSAAGIHALGLRELTLLRSAKAGRCMPTHWASSWACTRTLTAASATCRPRPFAPRGWWWTPDFTRSAGRASGRSIPWSSALAVICRSSPAKSIATPLGPARRWPT